MPSAPYLHLTPSRLAVPALFSLAWAMAIAAANAGEPPGAGATAVEIANPLALDWPWELVHRDLPAGTFAAGIELIAEDGGSQRPAQCETLADGRQRVWFIVTLAGKPAATHQVRLRPGHAESTVSLSRSDGELMLANGVNRLRLPEFSTPLPAPGALSTMRPPITACQLAGDHAWYGRSWFTGDATVSAARSEVLAQGPVFALVRITYTLAGAPGAAGVPAPLADQGMGGVAWPPADRPGLFYEATVRVVAGDPWIDVSERCNLPAPGAMAMEWKDGLVPDAVLSIRWFDYQAFGGNTDLHVVPLRPQPKQRGPFVMLRPCWNQGPGGGQDFLISRGLGKDADPHAPVVGVVAVRPSCWLNPFAQTISCFAEDGTTARARFPLSIGMRAWALVVGERACCDTTETLNGLVRRHADWTLDKQLNDYVLNWPRDPALAGPHILLSRAELERLRHDVAANVDSAEMRVLRDFAARRDQLGGLDRQLVDLLTRGEVGRPSAPSPGLWLSRRYQDDFLNPTGYTRNVRKGWPAFDLAAGSSPAGPAQAALAYIFSDLDQSPGYRNGWSPGNPNFRTDQYANVVLAAACMLDHPDAKRWLAFGKACFDDDTKRVLLPPDGVGLECPFYSFYSVQQQLALAKVFMNTGFGNPVAENPLFRLTGIWHRHLLTPFDARLGIRHQAPLGDTHRWGASDGEQYGALAKFYKAADPAFASEMMAVWRLFRDQGMRGTVLSDLIDVDQSILPTPLASLDWSSHRFRGFGAILRSRFAADPTGSHETFATFRCGAAEGHAHNEQLSYHFYGAGTPVSLDYNCSYHPRGDHAALHNSMTFGVSRPFTHAGDAKAVVAREQLEGTGTLAAFVTTPVADLAVGEQSGSTLTLTPVEPDDAKFQYPYPHRQVARIVHRRFQLLVKHPPASRLEDYLVVRDETISAEPQQTNIHLLARTVEQDGALLRAVGQYDADISVYLAGAAPPRAEIDHWSYFDDAMNGPGLYHQNKDAASDAANAAWVKRIHDSDGEALIPPADWKGVWMVGEYQKWVRLPSAGGTPLLWVLYARKRGAPEPHFTSSSGDHVRVELGDEADDITLATGAGAPGQAVVVSHGATTVLLAPGTLPALGEIKPVGLAELATSPEVAR